MYWLCVTRSSSYRHTSSRENKKKPTTTSSIISLETGRGDLWVARGGHVDLYSSLIRSWCRREGRKGARAERWQKFFGVGWWWRRWVTEIVCRSLRREGFVLKCVKIGRDNGAIYVNEIEDYIPNIKCKKWCKSLIVEFLIFYWLRTNKYPILYSQ